MADEALDDMLLEAAGRPKGTHSDAKPGSSSRQVKRRSSIQDYSSDDRGDSKSENDFDDDDYERGGSSRKGDGSKIPLKKRFDSSDKDGEEGDRDGYESELSFGSDLYKDEEDRNRLLEMSELDREMILHDRAEARDNFKMRVQAGQRHKQQMQVKTTRTRERDTGPPSSRMRSSVRDSRENQRTSKENALHELVARRNKANDPDSLRKSRDAARERDRQASARKTRKRSFTESESDSEDSDDESSRERSDREGSDEDVGPKESVPDAEAQDIMKITIRRSKLAKWFMEPFFEDTIVGCYVRIGIGVSTSGQSIYRVCLVKNVDARDPDRQYKFENRLTYKYLNCIWGDEGSAARWQMTRASDQVPTDKECEDLIREIKRCGGKVPSKADCQKKDEANTKVSSFVYTAAKVKQMLQEKKMTTSRPSNIALEKDRIAKELGVAESRGDLTEVERLQARLKELEELSSNINKSKDAKALALAEMNRRNRFENFKNASDMKPKNADAKAGEAGYDPFSRRWTRSQNYYKTTPKVEKESEENQIIPVEQAVSVPAYQNLVKKKVHIGNGVTSLYTLHDFDLHIDLHPLQKNSTVSGLSGAGTQQSQVLAAQMAYMARKQRLEAKLGVSVGSTNERHNLTLTVNDYKRRRGLL